MCRREPMVRALVRWGLYKEHDLAYMNDREIESKAEELKRKVSVPDNEGHTSYARVGCKSVG